MIKLKSIDIEILSELIKNSRISDRTVAKRLGVSQPTVTRRRARMEKEGLLEYTVVPDFGKLGIEIMAISFSKWTSEALAELLPKERLDKQVRRFLSTHHNVIFAATGGSGLKGMNSVSISVHKDFADYYNWVKEIKMVWGKYVAEFDSYVLSLESNYVARHITFKYLPDYIKKEDIPHNKNIKKDNRESLV